MKIVSKGAPFRLKGMSIRQDLYNPAALFKDGAPGVLFIPEPQYLFQDSAGTTPVTASGDPVGRWEDASGNGNHAIQTTSTSRPIYRTDGAKHWLDFSGDKWMVTAGNVDFSGVDESSHVLASGYDGTGTRMAYELSGSSASIDGTFAMYSGTSGRVSFRHRGTVGSSNQNLLSEGENLVVSGSGKIPTDLNDVRVNGSLISSISSNQGAGNLSSNLLYVGCRGGSELFWNRPIYGLMAIGRLLTTEQLERAEHYFANRIGVTLP